MSKRFGGLWKDTWWLWIGLLLAGVLLGSFAHYIFFTAIPISFFTFLYFGLMRYDDDGNPKEGL